MGAAQKVILTGSVRDLHDRADESFRAQAKEDLAYKIIAGKHRIDVADVLDMAYDSSLADVREIGNLIAKVCNTSGDDRILAVGDLDTRVRKMVDDYVANHDDMVQDRADEILAEFEADQAEA